MKSQRRRPIEIFNLSFLDVVSCGFGAIILLLVIVKVAEPFVLERSYTDLSGLVRELEEQLQVIRGEREILNRDLETRIEQFAGGQLVGDDSDYNLSGVFNGYSNSCLSLIANNAIIGNTDTTNGLGNFVKPADYPGFLDAACNPTGQYGRWGDTIDLTMSITGCAVPVEEASWGQVKQLYNE